MSDPSNLQRFDSTMFDILRNEEGDNLLDFDELAGLFTDEMPLQLELPPASVQPAVTVTTLGPAPEQFKAEPQLQQGKAIPLSRRCWLWLSTMCASPTGTCVRVPVAGRPSLTPSGAAESEHTRAPNW